MTDRVRMKSLTVMNNPIITSHAEGRADASTVIEGDEFSTSEEHAKQLEAQGFAERVSGDAADISDTATAALGFQTSNNDAIATKRAPKEPAKADGPAKTAA